MNPSISKATSLQDIGKFKQDIPKAEVPTIVYKDVHYNKRYKTVRNDQTSYVYPVSSTRRDVMVKDDLELKNSYPISKAKFEKYYILAE